jgi:two-component system, LytTR family, response regulator AlgR
MNSGVPVLPLRVLLVDDEELARLRLRSLIGECREPSAIVVGEASNTAQALVWLAAHTCDVVLLDIHMPGRDGTQLAAELRTLPHPPEVVFVTAHPEHALQAFDLAALDYLTKPVKRERLNGALGRVAAQLALGAAASPAAAQDDSAAIVVSDRGRVVRVPLLEILYFKAELKYVTLRTAARSYVIDDPLSDLETRVGERFMRVHRNALVARPAVRALERRTLPGTTEEEAGESWAVCVAPVDEWLAVSRRQVAAVREALVAAGR